MLTDEQEAKAKEALIRNKITTMNKRIALANHKQALEWVNMYNLPYRVCLDYLKADHDHLEIRINPFYPLPQVPKEGDYDAFTYCLEHQISFQSFVNRLIDMLKNDKEGLKRLVDEIAAIKADRAVKYKQWGLEGFEPVKKWEFYFARFLIPYRESLKKMDEFELFGEVNKHTKKEINETRRYFIGLANDAMNNPGAYDLKAHYKQLDDYDKYLFRDPYMWLDDGTETPPQANNAIEIMYRELAREKYLIECTGAPEERLARIKRILKKLENEK